MSIVPAKTSSYNTVTNSAIMRYIEDYAIENSKLIERNAELLRNRDRTQLKAIAAELETVNKRLKSLVSLV